MIIKDISMKYSDDSLIRAPIVGNLASPDKKFGNRMGDSVIWKTP